MRPLKPGEIELLANTLRHLEGARLQKVLSSKKDLVLEFWNKGNLYFLWYEDMSLRPYLTFWPDKLPMSFKKSALPIQLFLKAHFVGRSLESIGFYPEYGRMIKLFFSEQKSLEFRLFPHGQNVLASSEEKTISLHRPKALTKMENIDSLTDDLRSVEEFSLEWLSHKSPKKILKDGKSLQPKEPVNTDLEKKKKKLKKAIERVQLELERKSQALWSDLAKWLQAHRSYNDLPLDYASYVDQKRSVQWNINNAFEKSKEVKRKRHGTEERLSLLKKELSELEQKGEAALKKPSQVSRGASLSQVKGRSLHVSENVKAIAGKSAKDNLKLLRQAKPWDLWFHLKDLPSSHLILFKPKSLALSPKDEERVIQWFFKQSFGKRWELEKGVKHEVLVAECRYVKPIKGDRLGRVTYQKEKTIHCVVKDGDS